MNVLVLRKSGINKSEEHPGVRPEDFRTDRDRARIRARVQKETEALSTADKQPSTASVRRYPGFGGERAHDPAAVLADMRQKRESIEQARELAARMIDPMDGHPQLGTIDQVNRRLDEARRFSDAGTRSQFGRALRVHTEDAKPVVPPEKMNEHGLQNSFANNRPFPFSIYPNKKV